MDFAGEKAIKSICGVDPLREGEYPEAYIVGHKWGDHLVTAIRYRERNYSGHALGWFDVFAGDYLIVSKSALAVATVCYEVPR